MHSTPLTDRLLIVDGDLLRAAIGATVAEAVADTIERHAREVRDLRRSLFALKRLLTAHEAGIVLGGVSAATVMGYVREKGLPCYRPGKAPLFLLDDLVEWARRFPEATGADAGTADMGDAHAGGAEA